MTVDRPVLQPARARSVSAGGPPGRVVRGSRAAEVGRFLVAGGLAYAADVVVFNLLLVGAGTDPLLAKTGSSAVAIVIAFLGHRYLTWRAHPPADPYRAAAVFVALSLVAAFLQLVCLWVGHLLGGRGVVADNLSGNVVGMGLATAFRYWSFRRFVFEVPPEAPRGQTGPPAAGAAAARMPRRPLRPGPRRGRHAA